MPIFYPPFYPYTQPKFILPATRWTQIQEAGIATTSPSNSQTLSWSNNVVTGNLLIVNVTAWSATSTPNLTVTDSQGSYTQDVILQTTYGAGSNVTNAIYHRIATSSASNTVTVATNVFSFITFSIEEINPPSGTVSVDASSTGTGSSATAATGSLALTQTDYIAFGTDVHTTGLTYTAGATFQLGYTANGPTSEDFASQYNWNAQGASITPSLTISSTSSWNAVAAAYKVSTSIVNRRTVTQFGTRGGSRQKQSWGS